MDLKLSQSFHREETYAYLCIQFILYSTTNQYSRSAVVVVGMKRSGSCLLDVQKARLSVGGRCSEIPPHPWRGSTAHFRPCGRVERSFHRTLSFIILFTYIFARNAYIARYLQIKIDRRPLNRDNDLYPLSTPHSPPDARRVQHDLLSASSRCCAIHADSPIAGLSSLHRLAGCSEICFRCGIQTPSRSATKLRQTNTRVRWSKGMVGSCDSRLHGKCEGGRDERRRRAGGADRKVD